MNKLIDGKLIEMNRPECIWKAGAALGEGPVWSVREQALYWTDILNCRLHRHGPDRKEASWQFDQEICAVAERENHPGLIITLRHGFAFFDPATEQLTHLMEPEADLPGNRFNDGKCDRHGRFWAGTMDFAGRQPTGSLYRLSADLTCTKTDAGYPVTNGPAWSRDHTIMYHNDSVNGRVYAFDFDADSGTLSNKRVFLEFGPEDGSPDGMATDAEGGLWIAQWGAGKVTRRAADGAILQSVTLPCRHVTSCAFGGPDLTTLFITTASTGLTEQQLLDEPLAGGLFALETGITGLPADRFRG